MSWYCIIINLFPDFLNFAECEASSSIFNCWIKNTKHINGSTCSLPLETKFFLFPLIWRHTRNQARIFLSTKLFKNFGCSSNKLQLHNLMMGKPHKTSRCRCYFDFDVLLILQNIIVSIATGICDMYKYTTIKYIRLKHSCKIFILSQNYKHQP